MSDAKLIWNTWYVKFGLIIAAYYNHGQRDWGDGKRAIRVVNVFIGQRYFESDRRRRSRADGDCGREDDCMNCVCEEGDCGGENDGKKWGWGGLR